ncbi:response regulator [Cohnella sp. AR92]|uniref:response regulator n=1 Tax=Cohnella sp. AR92 TaxID=648716 RepID=UPI000F8E21D1|nr:response regulator [Cohnella sp. AR92]RUS46264.1 response regulator [Cohnella sp. AR92]
MYKLLIADDEPEVTESLLEEIDWASYGFEKVWPATNGREAMELIEREEPDVLVTDINMPYMNGLELSEWVKKTYPLTRIVILSGYDEFEYAKQAIQLQADDYLLKPFSDDQLISAIRESVRRMDEERERRSNVQLLQEHYRTTLPIIREKFLSSLITRRQPLKTIREKAEKYDLKLDGKGYLVSVVGVQPKEEDGKSEDVDSGIKRPKLSDDLDLMLFTVCNIADEIWSKRGLGKAFIHQDQVVLFTASPHLDASPVMEETQDGLKEILKSIEVFVELPVTIGVGTFARDIGGLKESYESALDALDYRRIIGINRIIYIGDLEPIGKTLTFDEAKERSLTRAVKVGSEEELREEIDALFEEIARAHVPVQEYELYMLEMVTAILKLTKDVQGGSDDLFGGASILNQYRKLTSADETKNWFADLCLKLRNRLASGRQRASKQIVEEAISYARSNFQNADLSTATLCEHLHISAGYFSNLFKKETRMTFGAFLLRLRMEKTMELLRTTNLKTFEISDRVGFSDPNYLGLCFKKYAGVTPKEYRAGLPEISG